MSLSMDKVKIVINKLKKGLNKWCLQFAVQRITGGSNALKMYQAKKVLPKLFFIICVISALVIVFVTLVDFEEDRRPLAQKKDNGSLVNHKAEQNVKSKQKVETERSIRVDQTIKTEQPVKTAQSIRIDEKIKAEQSIEIEQKIKTEQPVKTAQSIRIDQKIKTEQSIGIDQKIKTEQPVKTAQSIRIDQKIKAEQSIGFKIEQNVITGQFKTEQKVKIEQTEQTKTEQNVTAEQKIKIGQNVITNQTKIKQDVRPEEKIKIEPNVTTEQTKTKQDVITEKSKITHTFLVPATTTFYPEIVGWEINVSRNLNHYIRKDNLTATIIPKDFCDSPAFLVIMCISSPSGFEPRKVIRNTWGKDRSVMGHNVSLYFLIGQTTDLVVQNNITKESLQYKDIVQEDFYDSYNNLSLKSAMMLKLFSTKCEQRASYLLKIDDDIYLNLPRLVDDLKTRNQPNDLLMGSVICGSRPIKDIRDKWYAGPSYLYPYNVYPHYVSGTSYCMSKDVPRKILAAALQTPIFHLEDVYLTGICSKKIGLSLTHNGRFTFHFIKPNFCLYKPLITIHYQGPDKIQKIHSAMSSPAVEAECQKESQVFFVHKWLVDNVLILNKSKRRPDC